MIITMDTNKPYIVTYGIQKGKLYMTQEPIRYKPIRYFFSTIRALE